jgi:hypothetical protein
LDAAGAVVRQVHCLRARLAVGTVKQQIVVKEVIEERDVVRRDRGEQRVLAPDDLVLECRVHVEEGLGEWRTSLISLPKLMVAHRMEPEEGRSAASSW